MVRSATAEAAKAEKNKARRQAHEASRDARRASTSEPVRILARIGLGARTVVYLLLGYLTADIAAGHGQGKSASSQGALEEVARQPAGPALLLLLAVGFFAYAAWRLLQSAAGDPGEDRGTDAAKRVGWAAIGALYVALAVRSVLIVAGKSSSSNTTFSAAKSLLKFGGPGLLAIVGFAVVAGGVALSAWAVVHDFGTRLDHEKTPRKLLAPANAVETFGNVVRGLAFAAIGGSLVDAAVTSNATHTKGLNGALHALATQPYGPALLAVAAAGFVAFGLASLLEACFRKVDQDQRGG